MPLPPHQLQEQQEQGHLGKAYLEALKEEEQEEGVERVQANLGPANHPCPLGRMQLPGSFSPCRWRSCSGGAARTACQ